MIYTQINGKTAKSRHYVGETAKSRLLLCDIVFLRPLIHINKSFFIADKIENVIAPKQQTRCHVIYNPSVAFDCNNI